MRKIIPTIVILLCCTAILCSVAQVHYEYARSRAITSEGTDLAIETVMKEYGFKVEALDPDEPDMAAKIVALF